MRTTVAYILHSALRDRLFAGLCVSLFIAAFVARFLGDTALVEQQQMAVAYLAGSGRIILNAGLIVFICFHIRRSMEQKEIDVMLSRPLARYQFILAYWLALAIAALLLVLPLVALVAWFGQAEMAAFFPWAVTLLAESLITVAFTLFIALRMESIMGASLSAMGFYLLSRMMGFFVLTTESYIARDSVYDLVSSFILKLIAVLMPRLDLFAQSNWLVHGLGGAHPLALCAAQTTAYVFLSLAAAAYDLRRRQF